MNHPSHADTLSDRSAEAAGQAKSLAATLTSAATGLLLVLALLAPTAARPVDGCLVLLCFAAPSWKAIPQCVPPIRQVLRDLARGKDFPSCGIAGAGSSAHHAWARAPGNCPPQYTLVHESESGPIYTCDYSGAVSVSIEGKSFTRTWWNMSGDTVTDYSPAAKAQLGSWDTQFDDDHAAWKAVLPPAPCDNRRRWVLRIVVMDTSTFLALALACAPQVHASTARALVTVESALNPWAIGVVGGALHRQPRHRTEAISTAEALQAAGRNFSVGLGRINVGNFSRLGLSLSTAFEPCTNLAAMQTVLSECFERAQRKSAQASGD